MCPSSIVTGERRRCAVTGGKMSLVTTGWLAGLSLLITIPDFGGT
jgi:hypothetical protein